MPRWDNEYNRRHRYWPYLVNTARAFGAGFVDGTVRHAGRQFGNYAYKRVSDAVFGNADSPPRKRVKVDPQGYGLRPQHQVGARRAGVIKRYGEPASVRYLKAYRLRRRRVTRRKKRYYRRRYRRYKR